MKGAIVTVRNLLHFAHQGKYILSSYSEMCIQLPQDRYLVIEALLKRTKCAPGWWLCMCELEKESAARESFRARLDKKRPDGQLRAHRAAMLSLSRRSALLRFRHPQIDQDTYGAEG
jgi:hypothetical protein